MLQKIEILCGIFSGFQDFVDLNEMKHYEDLVRFILSARRSVIVVDHDSHYPRDKSPPLSFLHTESVYPLIQYATPLLR